MSAKNDITGDAIRSKIPSEEYRKNYDLIFGKKSSKLSGCEYEDGNGYCSIKKLNSCEYAIPVDNCDIFACELAL